MPVLRELLVDPRVQSGQRSLDRGERGFEVVVVAVVGVVDVENESARAGVEGSQHPDAVGIDAVVVGWGYGQGDFADPGASSGAAHVATIAELRRALGV